MITTDLSLEMFNFLCDYQALDQKGREAVQEVICGEFYRCSEERNSKEYSEEDLERDLKKFEDEIGIELL